MFSPEESSSEGMRHSLIRDATKIGYETNFLKEKCAKARNDFTKEETIYLMIVPKIKLLNCPNDSTKCNRGLRVKSFGHSSLTRRIGRPTEEVRQGAGRRQTDLRHE